MLLLCLIMARTGETGQEQTCRESPIRERRRQGRPVVTDPVVDNVEGAPDRTTQILGQIVSGGSWTAGLELCPGKRTPSASLGFRLRIFLLDRFVRPHTAA